MWNNPLELRDEQKPKPDTDERDPFGRVPPQPAPEPEISNLGDTSKLSRPVGEQGRNDRRDVAKVETMLGRTGSLDLKKTDGPTGYWGERTRAATRTFQKQNGLKVDGRINPGGETIRTLAKVAGGVIKALAGNTAQPAAPSSARHSGEGRNPALSSDQDPGQSVSRAQTRGRGDGEAKDQQASFAPRQKGEPHPPYALPDDVFQANQRMARALAKRKGIGDFDRFTTDAINTHGDKAVYEVGDLIRQVRANDPEQADELLDKTRRGIAPANVRLLAQIAADENAGGHREPEAGSPGSENAGRQNAHDGDKRRSLDARVQDVFGLEPDVQRPKGLLPMPGKLDEQGEGLDNIDWSEWTAPEWVHEGAKTVALPKHVLDGGEWSSADVTKAAMTVTGVGAAGNAPPGALRSGVTRLRGTPKFMRKVDLEKQGQAAARKAMDEKSSIPQAMFREDVGEITFDYGSPKLGLEHVRIGRTRKDGMSEQEALDFVQNAVPEVLAHGTLKRIKDHRGGRRVEVSHKGKRVVLAQDRVGKRETWVITGFEEWD